MEVSYFFQPFVQYIIFRWYRYPHAIIYAKEGPNDGLVSVESSRWGTYLGTLENANHIDLVGWTDGIVGGLGLPTLRLSDMGIGQEIRFSPDRFYLGVADLLAGVEEGDESEAKTSDEAVPAGVEGEEPVKQAADSARERMGEVLSGAPDEEEDLESIETTGLNMSAHDQVMTAMVDEDEGQDPTPSKGIPSVDSSDR